MTNVPHSIGVIMDGNRRWAKERGLPTFEGHRQGLEKIKDLMAWAQAAGVREVILYAFSTENWNRSREEVNYLMQLFERSFKTWMEELERKEIRIRFLGREADAPERVQKIMKEAEERTKDGAAGTLAVAFSYGGRSEILAAVNALLAEGRKQATEGELREKMWSTGLADPDLIIRTSGEKRLSNFLTWQSVYSELFFTDTYWPDFSKEEFVSILNEYGNRQRRHGK
jgi:undecaprenyl diphosphate synthase